MAQRDGAESNTRGVLAIWHDIADGHEADVLHWYNKQHHLERLGVPGFLAARRHDAVQGSPRLFVCYRTASPDVLTSPAYLERVNNPTDWTRECMRHFRNNSRTVCRVTSCHGVGGGGFAATLRFSPKPERETKLTTRLDEQWLPAVAGELGMCSAELWQADAERTTVPSEEISLRGRPDELADWVVVLTGSDEAAVREQAALLTDPERLTAWCVSPGVELGIYQLSFALDEHEVSGITG